MNNEQASEVNASKPLNTERNTFFSVLITTFTTVFLAELGDKTQLATLLLTTQSGMPIVVFLGASLALICASLVGVLIGRWLAKTMPSKRFEYIAGILMVSIGLLLALQATQSLIHHSNIS